MMRHCGSKTHTFSVGGMQRRTPGVRECLLAAVAIVGLGCGERVAGPVLRAELGTLRLARLVEGDPAPLPAGTLRLRLTDDAGALVADTTVDVAAGQSEIAVSLRVSIVVDESTFLVDVTLTDLQGATLFSGGPVPVTLSTSPIGTPPDVAIPMTYVGPGAHAAQVRVIAIDSIGFEGDTLELAAEVLDSAGVVIEGVPLEWLSVDLARASVLPDGMGRFRLGGVRGAAQVRARTYGGVVGSATLGVTPVPNEVVLLGPAALSAEVGSSLSGPVSVRLLAPDGLPVAGIETRFVSSSPLLELSVIEVVSDSAGEAHTEVVLPTLAGTYTISASPSRRSGAADIDVTAVAGVADSYSVEIAPIGSLVAGESLPPIRVEILDIYGNRVPSVTDSLTLEVLTSDDTPIRAPISVSPVGGVAVFDGVQLTAAGAGFRVRLTVPGFLAWEGQEFVVQPGAIASLLLSGAPEGVIAAGAALDAIHVTVADAFGNLVSTFDGDVSVHLAEVPEATLLGTRTRLAAGGTVVFDDLEIRAAGQGYTLVFTVGAVGESSPAFDVAPGSPTRVAVISTGGASTVAGVPFPPISIGIWDMYGNLVPSTDEIVVSLAPHEASPELLGTVQRSLVAGLATFDDLMIVRAAAGYELEFASGTLETDTLSGLSVNPAAPTRLEFMDGPTSGAVAGTPLETFSVSAADAFGNATDGFAGQVTIDWSENPEGAALLGTLTRPLGGGLATFSGVTVGHAGQNYRLTASVLGLAPAVGPSFDVLAPEVIPFRRTLVAGERHACALGPSGEAYCWGLNTSGRLMTESSAPVLEQPLPVLGTPAFSEISSNTNNICGIDVGGAALCWGGFYSGTPISGAPFSNVVGSGLTFCGLDPTGAAYCWGRQDVGEFGDGGGMSVTYSEPVPVSGGLTFAALAGAPSSAQLCGLTPAGRAYCWGRNSLGALGDGTVTNRWVPTEVAGGLSFSSIYVGTFHACALTALGAAWCWGSGQFPPLGTGATPPSLVPVEVPTALRFRTLTLGHQMGCGLTLDGTTYCWGDNEFGQLGNGSTTTSTTPVAVMGGPYLAIAAGGFSPFVCALTPMGSAECWGDNSAGQLGIESRSSSIPDEVVGGRLFAQVSAGGTHTCAVDVANIAYCWGSNAGGSVGDATVTDRAAPTAVSGGLEFVAVSAGLGHSCALTTNASAYCWGLGSYGRLGTGATLNRLSPTLVLGDEEWASIVAGNNFTCGLTTDERPFCWGENADGQLGDGSTEHRSVPTALTGDHRFVQIAAGADHACGLTESGVAYCWGRNWSGQLGDGGMTSSQVPVQVAGGQQFTQISAGSAHSCGVQSGGAALCWGNDMFGALGRGSLASSSIPVPVTGGLAFASIHASNYFTCGRTTDAALYCWGRGAALGNGSYASRSEPTAVANVGPTSWASVDPGGEHTCAVASGGSVWCWGANLAGELGNGSQVLFPSPMPVSGNLTFKLP